MVRYMTEQFIAGIVGAPFGLKGFVKVKPLSGEIEHLLKLKSAILRQDGKERMLIIEESSAAPPIVMMRFTGYNNPEAVKMLGGAEILVSRADAAPLQPDQYYVEDLKGLTVHAGDGNNENSIILGVITAIIEGGGCDLVEIRLNNGELKLVPFRDEFFTGIDLEKRQVILKDLWVLE